MKKSRHTRALKSLESSDSEKENAPRHVKTEKCVDNPLSTIEPSSYANEAERNPPSTSLQTTSENYPRKKKFYPMIASDFDNENNAPGANRNGSQKRKILSNIIPDADKESNS